MTWTAPRSARILFASTLALAALGAASALSAEPPPASTTTTGHASGKRMYKPYAVNAQDNVAACTAATGEALKVTSDPEEGGQVTAARSKGRPNVSDMHVTKHVDTASPKLMDAPAPSTTTCPPVQH